MANYTLDIPNDLRIELDLLAAKQGPRVKTNSVVISAIESYLTAQGHADAESIVNSLALAEITCQEAIDQIGVLINRAAQAARLEALDNWTEEHCP